MKKISILFAILALFIGACSSGSEEENTENTDSNKVAELTEAPTLKINEFDDLAGEFVDKEIQVKGIVDHVCKHGGKKLFLVDDGGDLHVESEERFNDSIMGSEIMVVGIVREFRVDEAYCLKEEEDNIKSHSEGKTDKELYERKNEHVASYRDSMKAASVDHLSFYSLEYISHKEL